MYSKGKKGKKIDSLVQLSTHDLFKVGQKVEAGDVFVIEILYDQVFSDLFNRSQYV